MERKPGGVVTAAICSHCRREIPNGIAWRREDNGALMCQGCAGADKGVEPCPACLEGIIYGCEHSA